MKRKLYYEMKLAGIVLLRLRVKLKGKVLLQTVYDVTKSTEDHPAKLPARCCGS